MLPCRAEPRGLFTRDLDVPDNRAYPPEAVPRQSRLDVVRRPTRMPWP